MKDSRIENLLSIENNVDHFHTQFEQFMGIDQHFRDIFKNNIFLLGARKAFLYEYYALSATSLPDKIGFLFAGIDALEKLSNKNTTPLESLYVSHYLAKLYYQLGVTWTETHSQRYQQTTLADFLEPIQTWAMQKNLLLMLLTLKHSQKTFLQLATEAYQNGLASYEQFKTQENIDSIPSFCDKTYALHAHFQELDHYSPCARLISLYCNLYWCAQEDDSIDISNRELLANLSILIDMHQSRANASMAMPEDEVAINDVKNQLHVELGVEPTIPVYQKRSNKKQRTSSRTASVHSNIIDWSPAVHHRDDFAQTLQQPWVAPGFLRPRQQQDFQTIYEALKQYRKPLIITKPTGTGKTALFSSVINQAWQHQLPSIIIVPSNTLALQTRDKLCEYRRQEGMHYAIDHINVYCPTEKLKTIGPITIVTQSSYVRQMDIAQEKFPTKESLLAYLQEKPHARFEKEVFFHPQFFALLIVDEGHHVVGKKLYNILKNPAFAHPTLLFSASTLEGEYKKIDELGQHIITQTLQESIENHELASLQTLTIDFSMYKEAKNLSKMLRETLHGKEGLDKEAKDLIEKLLCEQAGFSLTALSLLMQIRDKIVYTRKAMVFTDSIQHANLLAKLLTHLSSQRVRAFHTQAPDRQAILSDFKQNRRGIIVAVGALDEGFDDPDVNVILDFSIYVHKIRRIIQRLGRALRLREDGSGAILLSIKLLTADLQLIPRDEILGHNENGYIGVPEPDIINEKIIQLSLPGTLNINEPGWRPIIPQSAKIVFPKGRKPFNLGHPPGEKHDHDLSHKRIYSSSASDSTFFSTQPIECLELQQKNTLSEKTEDATTEHDIDDDAWFEALACEFG